MLSSKSMKNGLLRILNAIDSAGQGKKRDEKEGRGGRGDGEEGGTGRKEGRGGRRHEDSEKVVKK